MCDYNYMPIFWGGLMLGFMFGIGLAVWLHHKLVEQPLARAAKRDFESNRAVDTIPRRHK